MKMIWRRKWLVTLLAAGCVWLHTVPARATERPATGNSTVPADDQNPNQLSATASSSGSDAVVSNSPVAVEPKEPTSSKATKRKPGLERGPLVVLGANAEVKEGDTVEAVVVIGGSATVRGKVRDAVVAVGGDIEVDGEVNDTVVAVMGNVKVGPQAIIHQDVVSVGGTIDAAEGAIIKGHVQQVELPGKLPLGRLEVLKPWFTQCVFKLRPLAPQVGWVWAVAVAFFLLYFLMTLAFPKPVAACVEEMTRRPATTFLMGLLTKLLVPLVLLLLVATGVGVLVVPFVFAALLLGALLGKAALLQYLGRQIGRQFGVEGLQKPLVAFSLGWILITFIYLVPILGLLIFAVTGLWGMGAAVMAAFAGLRRETPAQPIPTTPLAAIVPSPGSGIPPVMVASGAEPMAFNASPGAAAASVWASTPIAAPTAGQKMPPVISTEVPGTTSEALMLPRAGFWVRMLAALLDAVLVALLSALVYALPLDFARTLAPFGPMKHVVGNLADSPFPALAVALMYFAGLWAWRGTTVGGIVLNLKVVRHDGKPMTFPVALVRALAAAFSAVVLFLGFFWIAWSRDKQGWHDKIAGTVVVRQARGTPLI